MIDLSRPALDVAPHLLGAIIRHGPVSVRITEVEAYMGLVDPASHAFNGPGGRAAVMFGPPGRLYVYLSYGIHHCINVICSPDGVASGVLLRAGEVVGGNQIVRDRRGPKAPDRKLASGPGNLGQALGVELADSGMALALDGFAPPTDGTSSDWSLEAPSAPVAARITTRIGISKNAETPWRFIIPGEPTVSGRRH
ncbi:3-methyladenine DNA glycosylase [Acidipropionibacterium jensenii]|uniref:Putative 3-methyladenine DNA glycosylase n=1 Tax=Acidipropionibacterium jensenii TaxID=1749 RepID=A0A448NYU2_9ACTN|nr:DNA-3-methyladenine glycosylase [Acidipropionibacterium jensenii]VEI03095.1 3-methyladenine DNA glycosylase [Acidipropionibacterium jensenii]